ncbi:hypothetical protein [Mycobacterium sp. PSTR-4-N]|uniref:hypothetical protein n=1 Tax=Mycobacterium sp. PSTR-4-N TaxID=2917745 RepID=UPI001F14F796|nr:hypothetical protein [Mycobacterium sp. PSTR-4-N]MCG7592392.1 hypothetical protein [Mycobacterium sp. PSTR-4-N]
MTQPTGDQQQNNGPDQGGSRSAAPGGAGSNADATFTQDRVNALLAEERRNTEKRFEGHDDFKAKAEQFDALTASQKTELQTANDAASDFKSKWETSEKDNGKLRTQLDRQKIAATKGLDPDLWDRVRGTTSEEIEADVQKLVDKFGTQGPRDNGPLRSGASTPDGQSKKERAASALRSLGANR